MNETLNKEIIEIPIEDIVPNRFQPRLTFDIEALNDLANSIKEHGIIQPLVVRKIQDKYEIIAGERRFKAASLIGMQKVPCIVMNLSDNESAEVAVIENIQRKEMTPLEEAKSFKKILDKGYLTQDELAKRMGKSQSAVANKLRLLNLDDIVQEAILNGKISERHARSLLKIEDKQEQRKVLGEILEKRLTVRQTDDLIKERYNVGADTINQNENVKPINPVNSIFKEPVIAEEPKKAENQFVEFKSLPEVNIPKETVNNPQTNLINGITSSQLSVNPEINQSSRPDINEFEKQISKTGNQDIKDIINPSVFAPIENKEPVNNLNVDINQIKNNAQDIIQKPEPSVDISNLMSSEKPENKFFVDLGIPNQTSFESEIPFRVKNAIDSINRKVDEIRMQGTSISKEEKDIGSSYQIIIRIDK